jgi:Protein of unknown function (DUF1353)
MFRFIRLLRSIVVCLLCVGPVFIGRPAVAGYDDFQVGQLTGKLIVQWWAPDQFIFIPDRSSPLTFKRVGGDVIIPDRMFTDGGSIPRPLWIFRNYSPWGYAPAFVVHDWLFEMHHCTLPGNEKYNHHIAADVMAEIMKTMMETNIVDKAELTLEAMHVAVNSSVAESYWNNGKCTPPPAGFAEKRPIAEFVIEIPAK